MRRGQSADVHVIGRLAVAYVSAPEWFVRELLPQPKIATAVANTPQRDS